MDLDEVELTKTNSNLSLFFRSIIANQITKKLIVYIYWDLSNQQETPHVLL